MVRLTTSFRAFVAKVVFLDAPAPSAFPSCATLKWHSGARTVKNLRHSTIPDSSVLSLGRGVLDGNFRVTGH